MEEKKYVQKLLNMSDQFDIGRYRDLNIKETHTSFEGAPKKHPSDENVLILLTSPFSKNHKFFEFAINSIGAIEDLGTISAEDGQSSPKIRVWIKKGMPALVTEPFIVE
ncbi:MAG: hypothetical protein GY754_02280 [bacterium]|nr:hypothetical protein [bacterium]